MPKRPTAFNNPLMRLMPLPFAILLTPLFTNAAYAQIQPAIPPRPATQPRVDPATTINPESQWARAGLTCGGGATTSSVATKPMAQCGGLLGIGVLDIEAGVMGPQANRSSVSGYLSTNLWLPLDFKSTRGTPVVVGGYTRMFETGHALDYGLAYARPINDSHFIQFEVRDYWAFANPNQHNVVFRVAWLLGLPND
jgi:hypothetical protein